MFLCADYEIGILRQASLRNRSTRRSPMVAHCAIKGELQKDIFVNFVIQYIIQIKKGTEREKLKCVCDRRRHGIPLIDNPVRKGTSPLRTFGCGLAGQSSRESPDSSGRPGSGE
ncbi:hypothetical protein BpHYR1_000700 [Brachionus plicatilis]|uniref:Uncharacterized protein n=1 Tax=Brachionus plicatilis TaxID=10195 RepID=A0A3M7T656_BRAPC|nr:hypothetical protein BpHYR1_000700 [Brachionus plicatilis]